mmetsp:Transcript_31652/g.62706  ORF Transcript_31652/g.62706 Transcript_31652/m.62706 type:complete len:323 (-) Transcript_31652:281-1249(-)
MMNHILLNTVQKPGPQPFMGVQHDSHVSLLGDDFPFLREPRHLLGNEELVVRADPQAHVAGSLERLHLLSRLLWGDSVRHINGVEGHEQRILIENPLRVVEPHRPAVAQKEAARQPVYNERKHTDAGEPGLLIRSIHFGHIAQLGRQEQVARDRDLSTGGTGLPLTRFRRPRCVVQHQTGPRRVPAQEDGRSLLLIILSHELQQRVHISPKLLRAWRVPARALRGAVPPQVGRVHRDSALVAELAGHRVVARRGVRAASVEEEEGGLAGGIAPRPVRAHRQLNAVACGDLQLGRLRKRILKSGHHLVEGEGLIRAAGSHCDH